MISRTIFVGAMLLMPMAALAQGKGPPNALQGFSQNKGQPVHIDAAQLEVRDKDKIATFSGDVKVKQGDTGLRCKSLVVYYEDEKAGGKTGAAMPTTSVNNSGGQQKISKLEAKGGVVVTQQDQTATGEHGLFDMKTNTVTLSGNVVMTTGPNVLRGDRLIVDLTNGTSRVENKNGRVQGMFQPGSMPQDGKPAASSAPKPQAPVAPGRPMQLN